MALLRFCRSHRLGYQLTTDLGLIDGAGPRLAGHAGVVLAGDERWVPPALASALRAYVAGGGHILSLGIDSLRRGVTLSQTQASHPTGPRPVDLFGARYGAVVPTHGAFVLAGHDALGLFRTTSGAFRFPAYQSYTGVSAPLTVASSAGTTGASAAIIGYHDGRGLVIDVGIPGLRLRAGRQLGRAGDPQPDLDGAAALAAHYRGGRHDRPAQATDLLGRRLSGGGHRLQADGGPAAAGLHALHPSRRLRRRGTAGQRRDPDQHPGPLRDDRVLPALLLHR